MTADQKLRFRVLTLMGICLLFVQEAEQCLAFALGTVLKDRTLTADKLMEQSPKERKRTLGNFLHELKGIARIEPKLEKKLWRFLEMRNTFAHNLRDIPGWDLRTEKGREVAFEFLIELYMLAGTVTCVFDTLLYVAAKDELGTDLVQEGDDPRHQQLAHMLEDQFGAVARKILAGRHRKPALVKVKH